MRIGPPSPQSVFAGILAGSFNLHGYSVIAAVLSAVGVYFIVSEIVIWTVLYNVTRTPR